MSIWFDASAVPESVRTEVREGRVQTALLTSCLVSACLNVGIPTITEANAREFYARVRVHEALVGALRGNDKGPMFMQPHEVRSHIGLRTNVTPKSEAAWQRQLLKYVMGTHRHQFGGNPAMLSIG